jgi:regulator of protease activity HflC (stomatin/prohibitin superfamily)
MLFALSIILSLVAFTAFALARRSTGKGAAGAFVVGVVFALVAVSRCITVVPAGHVGVVDVFGRVSPEALKSGLQFVNPFARIIHMSVQTQEVKETMDVPSREGLTVRLEMSVLYHLDPDKASDVYRTVGLSYPTVLLEPQFRSVTRGVTAGYEARALYTSEREQLAHVITADLQRQVGPRGVIVESTPMRKLTLPERLASAIEDKLNAEQESQRMQFVLQREQQESERKRIEAQGVADFQRIVSQGISEPLLRWKGIEATIKLAESQNAKVVVVGSAKDGLPLILGGQ